MAGRYRVESGAGRAPRIARRRVAWRPRAASAAAQLLRSREGLRAGARKVEAGEGQVHCPRFSDASVTEESVTAGRVRPSGRESSAVPCRKFRSCREAKS